MNKFLIILLSFLCFAANSQNVEAGDNAIKMGYNFVTVSQDVVFDNAMRAGGTLSLSALVADGGGRNPGDPFTMRLVFYDSNNQILSTVQQAWTLTLGATAAPYTISTPNCGESCANVGRVSVQFYGKDGGYWAGNYGPQIQSPTLKFNNGSNILYNPEFGIYSSNTFAQGWTSSNGWQNCQLYSGAQTCVINNNAPVNGGNYSATGGTSSGTAGGYTASPPPVVVTITTEQQNKINAARARQTYKNEVNIDQIGSYNSIDVIQSGFYNLVDVSIIGDSNLVDITQSGIKHYNKVNISGHSNTVNSYQSNTTNLSPGHFSEMLVTGNNNTIINSQTGEGEKSSFISVNGNSNSINNAQSGSAAKYSDIKTTGNGHTIAIDQKDTGAHKARVEVINSGGASNVNLLQQGGTPQSYILQQTCATIGGCNVTVVQQ